jgi:hypothetical protein
MTKRPEFRSGLSQSPQEEEADYIVLYSDHNQRYFAEAFLDAMNVIVDQLRDRRRISASDDSLTLPLLSLSVNAIEFSLKFFIRRYDEHRREDKCQAVPTPPSDFQKILLTKLLRQLTPRKGSITCPTWKTVEL